MPRFKDLRIGVRVDDRLAFTLKSGWNAHEGHSHADRLNVLV
jgi:hypothetical protein